MAKKRNVVTKSQGTFSFNRRLLLIVLIPLVIPLIFIGLFFGYMKYLDVQYKVREKIITKLFTEDIKQFPEIILTNFTLWEGDSMVSLEIPNKGKINFWYGTDKLPRIDSIDTYDTTYDCFYVDTKGQKTNYVYDMQLILDNQSHFKQWFPFQVISLKDIVEKYDEIIAILKTFPQDPPLIPFEDRYGKRHVRLKPDEKYMIKTAFNGKPVVCDLYNRTINYPL